MTRLNTLLTTACLTVLFSLMPGLTGHAEAAGRKPNVVFILIDDLGYNDVGCYGSTFHETPNIDRLASQGMRFTNGYAACPVCSPTRASIMCGKYPARINLTNFLKGGRKLKGSPIIPPTDWADQMEPEELTIAEALKSAGYATCFIGKWHLYSRHNYADGKYLPEKQGFDINIGGIHSGMPRSFFWPKWKGNPPIEGKFEGEYLPDRLSNEAVKFIDANKDKPFLLYLSHYTVHIPIQAKSGTIRKYQDKLAANKLPKGVQRNPYYAAMVEHMDDSVGRVLRAITRNKLEQDTIVIFTSDNGGLVTREGRNTPATTQAPLRAGKGYLYEGGIREPWIVKWPGVTKPASVCDQAVISNDFLPTICEMTGVKLGEKGRKTHGPIDGVSFTALLKDPDATLDRDALYWHYPHFSNQGGRPGGAVRIGDFKLIERYENGKLELYDLSKDISEKNNLAKKMPDKAKQMQKKLAAWLKEMDAQMPVANPGFKK